MQTQVAAVFQLKPEIERELLAPLVDFQLVNQAFHQFVHSCCPMTSSGRPPCRQRGEGIARKMGFSRELDPLRQFVVVGGRGVAARENA